MMMIDEPMKDPRAEIPSPSFPSEIFGMFIEALEDDQDSLRACSLVSSVFRHLCGPILYRDIALNRQGKVDTFVQFGERSDILRCAKSFTVTKSKDPHRILDTVSRKASLEILCISRVIFRPGTLTASILSRLSTVTVVILQRCAKLEPAGRQPVHDIAPVHLEVVNYSAEWSKGYWEQGEILGAPWLDLTGLKSFTYAIGGEAASELVLGRIAACEQLEEIDLSLSHSARRDFAIALLTPLVARVKTLTLRCNYRLHPLWTRSPNDDFPPSRTLERIRIITTWPATTIEEYAVLDNTFSDALMYPSLKEVEVCSHLVNQEESGRDTLKRLDMDKYLPRLKFSGRLPA